MLSIGDKAPEFDTVDQSGARRRLVDFAGRKLVLYFYPRDMTSGCTRQACDFRDSMSEFVAANAAVAGISPDSAQRHATFAEKEHLDFPLLVDTDHTIAEAYGVWKEKSMYGRTYMGIVRTTFVIDEQGRILRIWSGVKVPGHVAEVADALGD